MASEKSTESIFSFSNISTVLVTVIIGTFFITQDQFHEQRPDITGIHRHSPSKMHEVDARLWQDPLEASVQHALEDSNQDCKKMAISKLSSTNLQIQCDSTENYNHGHEIEHFNEDLNHRIIKNDMQSLDIIAVMLPGGAYSEESEYRRRIRYAVLSGLFAADDYQSEDAEHIHYFLPKFKSQPLNKEYKVAYEWVVDKTENNDFAKCIADNNCYRVYDKKPKLVMWLDNRFFSISPHRNVQSLFEDINKNGYTINVKVLGPYNSEQLQDLFNDDCTINNLDNNFCKNETRNLFKKTTFPYYPLTCDSKTNNKFRQIFDAINYPSFMKLENNFGKQNISYQYIVNNVTLPNSILANSVSSSTPIFEDNNFFARLSETEDLFAKRIYDELKLRQIIDEKENKKIVLLSEWDTLYGKELPTIFAKKLSDKQSICNNNENDRVLCYSYLRGLDGEKKRDKSESTQVDSSKAGENNYATEVQRKSMEDADGDSQFDYIRRLSDKLAEKNLELKSEGKAIRAIGILGSDVYDKLLVLEAMHDKFPEVVFFTTGMDARYLHPDQNKWARNLIVASSFGLELAPDCYVSRYLREYVPPYSR